VTTINRTPQSYLLAILAAEYVLKLVPQGTHNWEKFVKPNEIKEILEKSINCNFHF
jgi:2-polyprenyl-3-methyl-5-hydroxy-6-metoxy-1,4-benzoquinol methylase